MQHILAAKSSSLPNHLGPLSAGGTFPQQEAEMMRGISEAGLWIGPRPALEDDPGFRQLIPYVVLVDRDPRDPGTRFLTYRRTKQGDEGRLHGKWSIGFGGHVDLPDVVLDKEGILLRFTLENAAEREIREEIGEVNHLHRQWVGAIADNSNAVGRVHLGLVWVWMTDYVSAPIPQDPALSDVRFMDRRELASLEMETWSRMLLKEMLCPL